MFLTNLTLSAFLLALVFCLISGTSLIYALLFGLCCFTAYAKYIGFSFVQITRLIRQGILKAKNILIIFVLIGMMTALWRACGTIPFIVYYGFQLISPDYFVLSAFFLCCIVSFLTGTSFGTASTAGVICMMLSRINNIHPLLTTGAIMSGIYFGDRCSPMSSSASLICSLTETNIYQNIWKMIRSALVPFILTSLLYLILGRTNQSFGGNLSLMEEFPRIFVLSLPAFIPALTILILSCFRFNVKIIMSISILISVMLCLFIQKIPPAEILRIALTGFYPQGNSPLFPMVSGGGIISMVKVGCIVGISSSYFLLLQETGLLNQMQSLLSSLSARLGAMPATIVTSFFTCAFSCNQTLGTMLTSQLCKPNYSSDSQLALDLEDSVILIAAIIPWSIACSAPLAAIGGDYKGLPLAFFLYFVPMWRIILCYSSIISYLNQSKSA